MAKFDRIEPHPENFLHECRPIPLSGDTPVC